MIAYPEISVTKYKSTLHKIPKRGKISLTLWWWPETFKKSWQDNARQSGSLQTAQVPLGFAHQPHWIVTKNDVGFMLVFQQDRICAE